MKIDTTRFGQVDIEEEKVLHLVEGLYGFENRRSFIIIPAGKNSIFGWMQSIEEPSLAFVVANPFDFYNNYEFSISEEDVQELSISSASDVYVLTLLVVPSGNPRNITANLLAPIVINEQNKRGKQIILKNSRYNTKHPVINDLQNVTAKAKMDPNAGKKETLCHSDRG